MKGKLYLIGYTDNPLELPKLVYDELGNGKAKLVVRDISYLSPAFKSFPIISLEMTLKNLKISTEAGEYQRFKTSLENAIRSLISEGSISESDSLIYLSPALDPKSDDIVGYTLYQIFCGQIELKVFPTGYIEELLMGLGFLDTSVALKRISALELISKPELMEVLESDKGRLWVVPDISPALTVKLERCGLKLLSIKRSCAQEGAERVPKLGLSEATARTLALIELVNIMSRIRLNCPWDVAQTTESIRAHLLEEVHEALQAISKGDIEKFKEELGDILLQILFHSRIQEELGNFSLLDVAWTLRDKLVFRHPHVFGKVHGVGVQQVLVNWEQSKTGKARSEVPASLPALFQLYLLLRKPVRLGYDLRELLNSLSQIDDDLGKVFAKFSKSSDGTGEAKTVLLALLTGAVCLAMLYGLNPEVELLDMVNTFRDSISLDSTELSGNWQSELTSSILKLLTSSAVK